MAYVYRHIRLDKNEPFYIGIGSDNLFKRAFDNKSSRRNIIWNKIINKTQYRVDIIIDNISWEEACNKEKEFISLYGRIDKKNGILSNLTDGGDGTLGVLVTDEKKLLMSKRFSGKMNPMYGKKNSPESIAKGIQKRIGVAPWNKGLKNIYSKESISKMSESSKGKTAWNKGLKNVNGIGMAKIVLDLSNGIFYDSIKETSLYNNYKHSTLKSKLNGSNKNNTKFILV